MSPLSPDLPGVLSAAFTESVFGRFFFNLISSIWRYS